jgi:hypothetical protein
VAAGHEAVDGSRGLRLIPAEAVLAIGFTALVSVGVEPVTVSYREGQTIRNGDALQQVEDQLTTVRLGVYRWR